MTGFHAFVKKQKAIAFSQKFQFLDPGGRPAAGKEQGVRHKQMHMKPAFNDGNQRINPEAEVRVSTDDVDTGKVTEIDIFEHVTSSL